MKVLVLSHTSDLIGGAERSMLDVFDNWTKKYSIEPIFILREPLGTMVGEMNKRGWKYYPVKFTFWSYPKPPVTDEEVFTEYKVNSRAVKKIEKIIQKVSPDVVITNTIISPWAALAAYLQRLPHIWFVREYGDLDHDRQFTLTHGQTYQDIGNLSNLVVANSKTLASHIEKYVDKNKVATLYNPFDLNTIAKRAATKVSNPYKYPDSLKLIMTSNIAHTKGQLDAVRATGLLNKKGMLVELCLVGKNVDRPYNEKIEVAIKSDGLADKVHLIGQQPNVLAIVSLADIGVVASRKEAFGRTTFECLALGKAVVGANSGATPEMIDPKTNGYLYEPGNSRQLAELLEHYAKDRTLIKKHGVASRWKAKAMMQSKLNSDSLYKKLQTVARGEGPEKRGPVHFLTYWDNYRAKLKATAAMSIRKTLRHRSRQIAKTNYYRVRKIRAKLTGK